MAAKRSDQITPFDVMQNQQLSKKAASTESAESGASDELGSSTQRVGQRDFIDRQQGPLVLRIPPGYAIVLGVAIVGLIVLSYWVGYDRGDKARLHVFTAQHEAESLAQEKANSLELKSQSSSAIFPLQNTSNKEVKPTKVTGDLRRPGLNYFMLVLYPKDDAQRLIAFLGAQGVEAQAIPSHNGSLYQVMALKGFSADQLQSQEKRGYEALLRKLGRLWKTKRQGAGDLSDMYLALYKISESNPK